MKQSINHVQGRNFRELSSDGDLRRCDAVPDPLKEKLIKETAVDVSCCAAFFFCACLLGFSDGLLNPNTNGLSGCLVSMEVFL